MKTQIVINISYWNEKIDSTDSKLTIFKDIDKSFSAIQGELRDLILENKNDGFQFDIYEYTDHGFILIDLFYGIEDNIEEISIDYIKEYFNNFYDTDDEFPTMNSKSFDKFISLRINENDLYIEKELNNLDVEMETVKKYHVYERGAGDFSIEIICSVLTNIGVDLILTTLKSKGTDNSILKTERSDPKLIPNIKDYLLQNHGISSAGLKIGNIMNMGDYYYVECFTRYEKFEIEWSIKNELRNINIIRFNETRI